MLPTVATSTHEITDSAPRRAVRRVPAVLIELDQMMFVDHSWFAIDGANRRVPGVVLPTLQSGLSLIGQGDVATVVGRLRPELAVVDVDIDGLIGDAVTEEIRRWGADNKLWTLVRPSGGAAGRFHVFVAPGQLTDALESLLERQRVQFGVPRTAIDLRSFVRPLSAPHRSGVTTTAYGPLTDALAALKSSAPSLTGRSPARRTRSGRPLPPVQALTPRPRARRQLPPQWQHFLDTGSRPQLASRSPAGPDHTRSTYEAIATASMLRAGWSADEAWTAIERAHTNAMDHARASRYRWTRWVWNRAVEDDQEHQPSPKVKPSVANAVADARSRLYALAWTLPARQRPALLRVGDAVLARVARTGSHRVPVPERDLVLDTGLSDRKTIRVQLRLMDGTVGSLDRAAFRPGRAKDSSSFEFEIPDASRHGRGVSQLPPPSRHTPLPALALPTGTVYCLARALTLTSEPVDLQTLVVLAQLTDSPDQKLSPRLLRTARAALVELAQMGAARCDVQGMWVLNERPDAALVSERCDGRRRHLERTVRAERAAYRSGASSSWSVARAAALKAQHARAQSWWGAMSPKERQDRRRSLQERFARLSVEEQSRLKTKWCDSQTLAGHSPADRHADWVNNLSPEFYAHRSTERAIEFARLPAPKRIALARAWEQHRHRYGISRGTPLATSRGEQLEAFGGVLSGQWAEFLQLQQARRSVHETWTA